MGVCLESNEAVDLRSYSFKVFIVSGFGGKVWKFIFTTELEAWQMDAHLYIQWVEYQ